MQGGDTWPRNHHHRALPDEAFAKYKTLKKEKRGSLHQISDRNNGGIPVVSEPVKVLIPGDDVIRLGSSGAFEDVVVVGVFIDDAEASRVHHAAADPPHDPFTPPRFGLLISRTSAEACE